MALTVTSRGTGTHNTGATTLVPGGRSATLAAGSMGVLAIALDNAGGSGGSAGAVLIAPDTWTDAKSNLWTLQQNALYDNGAASAGIEMAFYTAPIVTALLTGDLGTMTWKTGVSPVAKAWTWYEVIPSGGKTVEYKTGGTIAGATAANAQVTTASVLVGDAVVAGYFSENTAAVTGDSDTTNGTWTAQQTATVGTTTAGVRIATQQKVQTTTASTQSYDVTVASQDRIAGYIMVREANHQLVTGASPTALAITQFTSVVTATTGLHATPGKLSLTTATYAPDFPRDTPPYQTPTGGGNSGNWLATPSYTHVSDNPQSPDATNDLTTTAIATFDVTYDFSTPAYTLASTGHKMRIRAYGETGMFSATAYLRVKVSGLWARVGGKSVVLPETDTVSEIAFSLYDLGDSFTNVGVEIEFVNDGAGPTGTVRAVDWLAPQASPSIYKQSIYPPILAQ